MSEDLREENQEALTIPTKPTRRKNATIWNTFDI